MHRNNGICRTTFWVKREQHFMRINKHLGSWLLAVWHTAPSNFIVSWMCLRKGHLVVKHLILTYILTFFDLARHQLQTSIYLSLFTWIAWDAPFSMIRCFTQFSSQHSQNHDKPRLANLCHLLHPAVAKGKHDRVDLPESTLRHLAFPKTFSCRIRCAWINSSKK